MFSDLILRRAKLVECDVGTGLVDGRSERRESRFTVRYDGEEAGRELVQKELMLKIVGRYTDRFEPR